MTLPNNVETLLAAVDRRRRQFALAQAGMLALVLLVTGGMAIIVLDWLLGIADVWRHILAWGLWVLVTAVLVRGLIAFWRQDDPVRTAQRIEAAMAEDIHERLSAAVALAQTPEKHAHWMVQRTVAMAAQEVQNVRPAQVLPRRQLGTRARYCVVALLPLLLGLTLADGRSWWGRALLPWADILRPAEYRIALDRDGDQRVMRGHDFHLQAVVKPARGDAVALLRWADGREQRLPLQPQEEDEDEQAFSLRVDGVMEAFTLQVQAGDGRSRRLQVQVDDPPRMDSAEVMVSPPTYTGQAPRRQDLSPLQVLAGSQVSVAVQVESPLAIQEVVMEADDADPQVFRSGDDGAWRLEAWQPHNDHRWQLVARHQDGSESILGRPWRVEVREDQAPQVRLEIIGESDSFARHETVVLRVAADDDVGLAGLQMVVEDGQVRRRRDLPVSTPHRGPWRGQWPLPLSAFAAHPGSQLTVYVEAEDVSGQRQQSAPVHIRVASAEAVHDQRRATRLRHLQQGAEASLQHLANARQTIRGLAVGISDADVRDIFVGELRQSERAVQRAVSQLEDVLGQWPTPLRDEIGQAEAGVRFYADAWLRTQAPVLQAAAAALRTDANIPAMQQHILRAENDMQHWLQGLRVVAGSAEAAVLVQDSQQRQAIASRQQHLVQAYRAWQEQSSAEGLWREVYRDANLRRQRESGVAAPAWEGARFAGSDTFSMRWRGAVRLDQAGEWRVHARVDDGLRIFIDNQNIIPDAAWTLQAPTEYSGTFYREQRGWQDIQIEFFQDGGGAVLELALESPSGERVALHDMPLRHFPRALQGERREDVVEQMVRISRGSAERAWSDLHEGLRAAHNAASDLARWASETGDSRLRRSQERLAADLEPLSDVGIDELGSAMIQAALSGIEASHQYGSEAHRRLLSLLRDWRLDREHPPQLAEGRTRHLADRLREETEQLRRERDQERREEGLQRARERAQALAASLADDRRALSRDMANPDHDAVQREQIRQARQQLRQAEAEHAALQRQLAEADSEGRIELHREARAVQDHARAMARHRDQVDERRALPQLQALTQAQRRGDEDALAQAQERLQEHWMQRGEGERAQALAQAGDAAEAAAIAQEQREALSQDPSSLRDAERQLQSLADEYAQTSDPQARRDIQADAAQMLAEQAVRADDSQLAQVLSLVQAELAAPVEDIHPRLERVQEILEDVRRNRLDGEGVIAEMEERQRQDLSEAIAQAAAAASAASEESDQSTPTPPGDGADEAVATVTPDDVADASQTQREPSSEAADQDAGVSEDVASIVEDRLEPGEGEAVPDPLQALRDSQLAQELADLARRMRAAVEPDERAQLLAEIEEQSSAWQERAELFPWLQSPLPASADASRLQAELAQQRSDVQAVEEALAETTASVAAERERARQELDALQEQARDLHDESEDALQDILRGVMQALSESAEHLAGDDSRQPQVAEDDRDPEAPMPATLGLQEAAARQALQAIADTAVSDQTDPVARAQDPGEDTATMAQDEIARIEEDAPAQAEDADAPAIAARDEDSTLATHQEDDEGAVAEAADAEVPDDTAPTQEQDLVAGTEDGADTADLDADSTRADQVAAEGDALAAADDEAIASTDSSPTGEATEEVPSEAAADEGALADAASDTSAESSSTEGAVGEAGAADGEPVADSGSERAEDAEGAAAAADGQPSVDQEGLASTAVGEDGPAAAATAAEEASDVSAETASTEGTAGSEPVAASGAEGAAAAADGEPSPDQEGFASTAAGEQGQTTPSAEAGEPTQAQTPGASDPSASAADPSAAAPGQASTSPDHPASADPSQALQDLHDALIASSADPQRSQETMAALALYEELHEALAQSGQVDTSTLPDRNQVQEAIAGQVEAAAQEAAAQRAAQREQEQALAAAAQTLQEAAARPLAEHWSNVSAEEADNPQQQAVARLGQEIAALAEQLDRQAQTLQEVSARRDDWADRLAASQEQAWAGERSPAVAEQDRAHVADSLAARDQAQEALQHAQQHGDLSHDSPERRQRGQERVQAAEAALASAQENLRESLQQSLSSQQEAQQERLATVPLRPDLGPDQAAQAAQMAQAAQAAQADADHLRQALEHAQDPDLRAGLERAAESASQEAVQRQAGLSALDPRLDQHLAQQAAAPALAEAAPAASAAAATPAEAGTPVDQPAGDAGTPAAAEQAGQAASAEAAAAQPSADSGPAAAAMDDASWAAMAEGMAQGAEALAAAASAQAMGEGDGQGDEGGGEGDGGSSGGSTPGQVHAGPAPAGIDQAAWARLPEQERRAIRQHGSGNFSEEHAAAIRAYTRRLLQEE